MSFTHWFSEPPAAFADGCPGFFGVSRDDLFVAKITADEAPTRKWRRFGARGRFKPLLRRSSHVTVILRERGA